MHRRRRHTDNAADARRTELARGAKPHDTALEPSRGLMRARTWTAGTVPQPEVTFGLPTVPPLVDGLTRHAVLRCDLVDRIPDDHQLDDVATRPQRQPGISVNEHEGLPERMWLLWQLHTYSRRPSLSVDPDVNNVRGHHN
jgi:hypothetical protein